MGAKTLIITICIVLFSHVANAQWFWESAESLYEQGMNYYKSKDYNNAVAYWTKAAEKDNVDAQFELGWMYYAGKDVEKDYKMALN